MPLIEDANLFMMCPRPHRGAFTPVPHGFSVRPARREEWDTWLTFPFDTQSSKEAYRPFMVDYFNRVYRQRKRTSGAPASFCAMQPIPRWARAFCGGRTAR